MPDCHSFAHGVASADPSSDAVTIWTRLTTNRDEATVAWRVATDPALRDVVRSGTALAHRDRDHTIHVRVDGLPAGRQLWYGFDAGESTSPVGRTSTLPAQADRARIAVTCCARYGSGWFHAYRLLAEEEPDLVLHLGDYLYEDDDHCVDGRQHVPAGRLVELADYRARYAQQHADPDVQRLHAACPWVLLWDDHEIAENSWRRGAVGHDDTDDGSYEQRRRCAVEAWSEWIPTERHQTDGGPFDRRLRIGDLLDILVVDARNTARDAPVDESGGPATAPEEPPADERTLLGDRQRAWLHRSLATSDAAWRLLANQVQIAPLVLGYLPHLRGGLVRPVVNPDQWDGYPAERAALLDVVQRERVGDLLALSGDLHATFVNELRRDGRTLFPELTTPSVTATSFARAVRRDGHVPTPLLRAILRTLNRDLRFFDLRRHGFTMLTIDRHAITIEVHLLDHVDRPAPPGRRVERWQILRGDPVPHRLDDGAMPPRRRRMRRARRAILRR